MGSHLRGEGGGLGGGGEWRVLIARHTVFLCPPHSPCSLGDFLSCLYPSGDDPTLNKPKKKNSRGLFERVGCVALCWAQCSLRSETPRKVTGGLRLGACNARTKYRQWEQGEGSWNLGSRIYRVRAAVMHSHALAPESAQCFSNVCRAPTGLCSLVT